MRRTSILLAAASATLLLVAACSSTKGSAATTTAKLASPTTTTPQVSTAVTDSLPPIVATGTHKSEPFCVTAVKFNNTPSPLNDSNATADDFKAFFTTVVVPAMAEMRSNEPAEVKAEVDTVASAFEKLAAALEANAWDITTTGQDPAVRAAIGTGFDAATRTLSQYCGFST